MTSKSRITIVSHLSPEITSSITVDNVSYTVYTEDKGLKSKEIVSTVYQKGRIVFSKKYDYSHISDNKDFKDMFSTFMEKQHKYTIQTFALEESGKKKIKSDYFEEIQRLLKKGKGKQALDALKKALDSFPQDPFFLSYYGCLVAIVEKKPEEGIKICKNAISRLDTTVPFGSEFFHSVFYLNLGRAYLSDNKKTEAIKSFKKGLITDQENQELLFEIRRIGIRRPPPLHFLKRSHPINKYIGMLLPKASR